MSFAAGERGAREEVKCFVSFIAQSQTLVETNLFLIFKPISYETALESQKRILLTYRMIQVQVKPAEAKLSGCTLHFVRIKPLMVNRTPRAFKLLHGGFYVLITTEL